MKLHKLGAKLLSLLLVFAMFAGMVPASAVSLGKTAQFSGALVEELAEYCGSEAEARAMLQKLYDAGIVDKAGMPKLADSFNVDGKTMTAAQLEAAAKTHDPADPLTLDGQKMTWGNLQELLSYYDMMDVLLRLKNGESVTLTDERKANMQSLAQALMDGELAASFGAQAKAGRLPAGLRSASVLADGETETGTVAVKRDSAEGKWYYEAPGIGESGYEAKHKFELVNQGAVTGISGNTGTAPTWSVKSEAILSGVTLTLTADKTSLTKAGGTITVTATLSKAQNADVTLAYRTVAGSFDPGSNTGTLTIPKGDTTKTFSITAKSSADTWSGNRVFLIQAYELVNAKFSGNKTAWEQQITVNSTAAFGSSEITIFDQTFNYSSAGDYTVHWTPRAPYDSYSPGTAFGTVADMFDTSKILDTMKYTLSVTVDNTSGNCFPTSKPGDGGGFTFVGAIRWGDDPPPLSPTESNEGAFIFVTSSDAAWNHSEKHITSFPDLTGLYIKQMMGVEPTKRPLFPDQDPDTVPIHPPYLATSGKYGAATKEFRAHIVISAKSVLTETTVTNISVPTGNFYPGQRVPITVTFQHPMTLGNDITLRVNGTDLNPVETNGKGDKATFLYTVKTLDSGSVGLESIAFVSGGIKSAYWQSGDALVSLSGGLGSHGGGNASCKLQTPNKLDSFKDDSGNTTAIVAIDDAVPSKQTVVVQMDISDKAENGNLPYIAWIAQNTEPLTNPIKVIDKMGAEQECGFYVKSMYISDDGGTTRYPLYVVAEEGNVTIGGVEYSEKPVALVANIKPEMNQSADMRQDSIAVYMDPAIGSTTDYIKDTAKIAPIVMDAGFSGSVLVKGAIFLEQDKNDVTVEGNAAWDATHESYRLQDKNETIALSYKINDRTEEPLYTKDDFTFVADEWFEWESSDTAIANISNEEGHKGEITPTGKEGSVTFKLHVKNGGVATFDYYVESAALTVKMGLTPFLTVPATSADRTVLTGSAMSLYFTSNLTARNDWEKVPEEQKNAWNAMTPEEQAAGTMPTSGTATEFKVEVFALGGDGTFTDGNKAEILAGTPVYTGTVSSTVAKTAGVFEIPADKLNALSKSGLHSYVARVSATYKVGATETPYEGFALVRVKSRPAEVKLAALDSYYVLDGAVPNLNWEMKYLNSASGTATGYYVIKGPGQDGTPVDLSFSAGAAGTIPTGALSAGDKLKATYTVSVYARNSDEEAWSVDSAVLYVYNGNVLKILVNDVARGSLGGSTGGAGENQDGKTLDLTNVDYVDSLGKSQNGLSVDLGGDVTLEDLRSDLNLQKVVSINYGEQVWGMLSDQIQWKAENPVDENGRTIKAATVDYYQGGFYADIESYDYSSYLPGTDFLVVGHRDGVSTVSATHARTGQSMSVDFNVQTLKDKLYLFALRPAGVITMAYVNGAGEERTVSTNGDGQLALYEPDGIASNVYLGATVDGKKYLGTIYKENLLSGEQDAAALQLYPCNNRNLLEIGKTTITVLNQDGSPYAQKDVVLRGGVYKNNLYCPDAYFATSASQPATIDGREDFTVKTDEKGRVVVYTDPTQFKVDSSDPEEEYKLGDALDFIFELRYPTEEGETAYEPVVIRMTEGSASGRTILRSTKAQDTPALYSQEMQQYYPKNADGTGGNVPLGTVQDVLYSTEQVGPSRTVKEAVLASYSLFPGVETIVNEESGFNEMPKDVKLEGVLYDDKGEAFPKQLSTSAVEQLTDLSKLEWDKNETSVFVYPFSSMPVLRNRAVMNAETFGRVEGSKKPNENGIEVYDYTYMGYAESRKLHFAYSVDGVMVKTENCTFTVQNMLDQPEIVNDPATKANMDKIDERANDAMDLTKIFSNIDADGTMTMIFNYLSQAGSDQLDLPVSLNIFPTEDPTKFDIIVVVGDMPEEMGAYMQETLANSLGEPVTSAYEMMQSAQEKADEASKYLEKANEARELWNNGGDSSGGLTGEASMSGVIMANATIDPNNDEWGFEFVGGVINGSLSLNYNVQKNILIIPAFLPVTFTFDASLSTEIQMTIRTNMNDYVDYLLDAMVSVGVEAFAGFGFDLSIITLKLGIFGSVNLDLEFLSLLSTVEENAHGELLGVNGEIGIQMIAKILFIEFSYTFCSTSFGWEWKWNDYEDLKERSEESIFPWSGRTLEGQAYTAVPQSDGTVMIAVEESAIESRGYLTNGNERVWAGGGSGPALFSLDDPNQVEDLQTNAYPASNPVYTDDGRLLLYIDDAGSADVQDTIASFATLSGAGYEQKGTLDAPAIRYGDSAITASGTSGDYFAAWVRQSEEIRKEAGDAANGGDLAMMINGTEIMVGRYHPTAAGTTEDPMWTVEALTANSIGDMAPTIASSGDKAIVAWRSVESSSADSAVDFDTTDELVFRVFNGTNWSDAQVAYNGSKGNLIALDTAILSDGTALIAYTVKTEKAVEGDNKDASTETFYTLVGSDGNVAETIRATTNATIDLNAQVTTMTQGGNEQFLLAWYAEQDATGTGSNNKDICLRAINADGSMDSDFPESVAGVSSLKITSSFQLATAPGADLDKVAISWIQPEIVDGGTINHLKAVKFYEEGGAISLTPPQELAAMDQNKIIDHFDAYQDDAGKVRAVLQVSDYTNCGVEKIGTVDGNEAVKAQAEAALAAQGLTPGTQEYDKAYAAKFSELKSEDRIDILASRPEALLMTATGEFTGGYTVGEPGYSLLDLEPGFELPVQFTLKNTGVTKIEKATVELGGETKEFTVNLQPGDTAAMMMYYLPEESGVITNPAYEVTAAGVTLTGENSGTLTLNQPDVGVKELKLVREENKERDVQVTLYNSTSIPLEGNTGKTVKVGFYSDKACTDELATPVTVDAANYDRIDSGTFFLTQTIDVTKLVTAQNRLTDAGEIDDKGLSVYVRTWIEEGGVKQEEKNETNNMSFLTFKGLLTKRVDALVTGGSMSKNEDGSYELTYTIQNNSYKQTDKMAFAANVLDKEGEVLTSRFFNGIQLGGEEKLTGQQTIPVDEVRGVPASVVFEVPEPPFAVSFETRGVVDKAARPEEQVFESNGQKVVAPDSSTLTAEDLDFAGWYSSQDYVDAYKWNFDDGVYCDVTLFANWVPHAGGHTVTFDAWTNGGTVERSIAGTDAGGKLIRELPTAEKSGYSFNGWFTAPEKGEKLNADTLVTEDTKVYAQFTPNGGSTSTPSVTVDGKKESIVKYETKDGVTTAVIDGAKLESRITAAANGSSVVVPITGTTLSGAAQLTVKNVQDMAAKDMKLEVSYKGATYTLPAAAVDTAALAAELGGTAAFTVSITQAADAKAEGVTIVGTPFTFRVSAQADGKSVAVERFGAMTTRTMEITKAQAEKVTTAVVIEADGSVRHVPTNVSQKNGKYYARVNSLTNSTYALISSAVTFADAADSWYEAAANEMGSRKIISGVTDGAFAGAQEITRAEFATMVVRALGLPGTGKADFTDVAANAWYAGAVGTASEYGIVTGSDGKFMPDAKITRQEAMVMLTRAAKLTGWAGDAQTAAGFTDINQVAGWAADSVAFNTANGLIVGSNGMVRPLDNITRGETATVLLRLLQKASLVDVRSNV